MVDKTKTVEYDPDGLIEMGPRKEELGPFQIQNFWGICRQDGLGSRGVVKEVRYL